jgi:hypothetical protein
MSIKNPTLSAAAVLAHFRHSFNYNIFPETLYYAKQTQCQVPQHQRKLFYNKHIRANGHFGYSDKQTQFKPKQTQFKANSNPICRKAKNDTRYASTKDYEGNVAMIQEKTNPIQTQFDSDLHKPSVERQGSYYKSTVCPIEGERLRYYVNRTMLIKTITLTTITMISIFFIKIFCLYAAKSSIVNNCSFSVADMPCVVVMSAGKSSIAINGSRSVTIASCIALTFPKMSKFY